MEDRGSVGDGVLSGGDHRQLLVVDDYQLAGILRLVAARRHDRRHRLADEQDPITGEERAWSAVDLPIGRGERRREVAERAHVLLRDDLVYATCATSRCDVD